MKYVDIFTSKSWAILLLNMVLSIISENENKINKRANGKQ